MLLERRHGLHTAIAGKKKLFFFFYLVKVADIYIKHQQVCLALVLHIYYFFIPLNMHSSYRKNVIKSVFRKCRGIYLLLYKKAT